MKTDTHTTLKRHLALLRAIPRHPQTIATSALATILRGKDYVCTRRTIERDLMGLSGAFPLFVDDSSRPYRWSWLKDSGFEFMPRLTTPQCVAIVLMHKHVAHLIPQAMLEELAPFFNAAHDGLARTGWKHFPARTAVVSASLQLLRPDIDPGMHEDVQRAIAGRTILSVLYPSSSGGEPAWRRTHPLGYVVRGPTPYLVCTIEGAPRIRTLALQRMRQTVVETAPCVEPEGFDFDAWVAKFALFSRGGSFRLHVRMEASAAAHLRETPLPGNQKWKPVKGENKVDVWATVEDDEQVRWWIMSLGAKIEVMKPLVLRKEIAADLARAAAMYVEKPRQTTPEGPPRRTQDGQSAAKPITSAMSARRGMRKNQANRA